MEESLSSSASGAAAAAADAGAGAGAEPLRLPDVIVTMTSCKRLALFQKCMRSIAATWQMPPGASALPAVQTPRDPRVLEWVVVDDNSSPEDRAAMVWEFGARVTFVFKPPAAKGHAASMNLLLRRVKDSGATWWVHLEDDWEFLAVRDYIGDGIACMQRYPHIHQVLFNVNYAQTEQEARGLQGDKPLDDAYSEHVYRPDWRACTYRNNHYWPHFSLRPSVIRVQALDTVPGDFTCTPTFFEMEYARKWMAAGHRSAFFRAVTCVHIGRLVQDVFTPGHTLNAYELNGVRQVDLPATAVATATPTPTPLALDPALPVVPMPPCEPGTAPCRWVVINLDRRPDRWLAVQSQFQALGLPVPERVAAVDGATMHWTKPLMDLTRGNDFGSARGVIACGQSHMRLWRELALSAPADTTTWAIFEDDVRLRADPAWLAGLGLPAGVGVLQLGHACKEAPPVVEAPWLPVHEVFEWIGGTQAYLIQAWAARVLLQHVHTHGFRHGIDYYFKVVPSVHAATCMPTRVLPAVGVQADTDVQRQVILPAPAPFRVRVLTNFGSQQEAAVEFGRYVATGSRVLLVADPEEAYDYTIVINLTQQPVDPGRTVVYTLEPWCPADKPWGVHAWGPVWSRPDPTKFLGVFSHDRAVNFVTWYTTWTWADYATRPIDKDPALASTLSMICSDKYCDPGHILRLDLARALAAEGSGVDFRFFGQSPPPAGLARVWAGPVSHFVNKELGLHPFRYYVMFENNREHNFVTEKLWEPLLAEALCFYWGAPNVADIVDPRAVHVLDPEGSPETWVQEIKAAIAADAWSTALPFIRAAKAKVLQHQTFSHALETLLEDDQWVFYPGVDSPDGDMGPRLSVPVDKCAAYRRGAVAVNTLGFCKSRVTLPLVPTPWIHSGIAGSGIYVRKDPPGPLPLWDQPL
jgi:hypothetical protein